MNRNFYTPFVNVLVTFQGKQLDKKFAEDHPEVMSYYPAYSLFMRIYLQLRNLVLNGYPQTLHIDEFCVRVNGAIVMHRVG